MTTVVVASPPSYEFLLGMLARAAPGIAVCEGAQVLPPAAREALRRAARKPIPYDDPCARARAIDAAIDGARMLFPHCFRKD